MHTGDLCVVVAVHMIGSVAHSTVFHITNCAGGAIHAARMAEDLGFKFSESGGVFVYRLSKNKIYRPVDFHFGRMPARDFPLIFTRRRMSGKWIDTFFDEDLRSRVIPSVPKKQKVSQLKSVVAPS